MVERSLSMREVLGSMPRYSICADSSSSERSATFYHNFYFYTM